MPKYAVHMIALEEACKKLKQSTKASERQIADLIESHKQVSNLGSIGPDLFFWAPDFEIVKKPLEFYKNFKWLFELYENTIGRAKDAIEALGKPVEKAASTLAPNTVKLIKKLINEINETTSLFEKTITTGLFAGIFEGYDFIANTADLPKLSHQLFDWFTPPLQGDLECPGWRNVQIPGSGCSAKNETKWYWYDMLHYRSTGKFAQNLINFAKTDEQKIYAYGYLSHIATDTVGHAFINEIVGGPFRFHTQRHATCENFIDTWKYHNLYKESINATLHNRSKFPKSKELYNLDYDLSDDIARLLYNSFLKTYQNLPSQKRPSNINTNNGAKAGFLTVEDIKETYQVFCFVFEVLGRSYVEKPSEPFSGILDILNNLLGKFETPPSPPSSGSSCSFGDIFSFGLTDSSRDCYKNFVENIGEWFKYIGELAKWAFETLRNLLDLLLTSLLSLPITTVMAILYGIQMLLYNIYRQLRWVLSLNGFVYPEPDEVLGSSFGRNFITPSQGAIIDFGGFTHVREIEYGYPRIHSHNINNLQFPNGKTEEPNTTCAWYPRSIDSTPDKFIHDDSFSEEILKQYVSANNPFETRGVAKQRKKIGNAIDFSAWLIKNATNKSKKESVYCNWNLDSDRGYGYKCWKADNLPSVKLKGEDYVEALLKPKNLQSFYVDASVLLVKFLKSGETLGNPGSDSTDWNLHYNWARKQSTERLRLALQEKSDRMVELRSKEGKTSQANFYGKVCVIWATYGVYFGSEAANSTDLSMHANWAQQKSADVLKNQLNMRIEKIIASYSYIGTAKPKDIHGFYADTSVLLVKFLKSGETLGSPASDSTDWNMHYNWARQQNTERLRSALQEKSNRMVELRSKEGKTSQANFYGKVCVIWATYGVYFGSEAANSTDQSMHANWAQQKSADVLKNQLNMRIEKIIASY